MIEHDEQHGAAAEEDGEGVEGGVGDHLCFFFRLFSILCLVRSGGCSLFGWLGSMTD